MQERGHGAPEDGQRAFVREGVEFRVLGEESLRGWRAFFHLPRLRSPERDDGQAGSRRDPRRRGGQPARCRTVEDDGCRPRLEDTAAKRQGAGGRPRGQGAAAAYFPGIDDGVPDVASGALDEHDAGVAAWWTGFKHRGATWGRRHRGAAASGARAPWSGCARWP